MAQNQQEELRYDSNTERDMRQMLTAKLRSTPIPDDQLLSNLGLFIDAKNMSRILFMDFLYRQIVDVMGVVMDFGTRWGHNLALFTTFRGIYEPFNRHRKIIGFDTFTGFPSISKQDGGSDLMEVGRLAVSEYYRQELEQVLALHEGLNPLSHIKKSEIRQGDATLELERHLKESPETIVALAYFDFDLYQPTKECLEMIRPRLTKGSVVGFDELNDPDSPGETLALMEVMGLPNVRLKRFPHASRVSYFIVE